LKITEIKKILDTEIFELNRLSEKKEIFWHWDNFNRFAVQIHETLLDEIKENKELSLHLEKEIKEAKQGKYTLFSIYNQKTIDRIYDDRVQDRSKIGEHHNDFLDAYENDESNFWNND
ncbi:MAG: hypothetical protein KDC67_07410, partial [Ignavibacteriae bacterium]|nr:hypothetical protein [Ignavibacteriota bacterium]